MLYPLAGECCRPFDAGFVVIKNGGALDGVFDGEVLRSIFEREELLYALIRCNDFRFGGALCCLVLADAFPRERAATSAYYVPRKGT